MYLILFNSRKRAVSPGKSRQCRLLTDNICGMHFCGFT